MKRNLGLVATFAVGLAIGLGVMHLPSPTSARAAPTAPKPQAAAPQPQPNMIEDGNAVYRVPLGTSPVRGPADALVTIVEVTDFECPFCKQAAPTLKKIEDAYRGRVRVAFKHNPLGFHANALAAAKLVEEARAQGGDARFWQAHDRILAAPSLDRAALDEIGKALGLDAARLRAGLDGPGYVERIREDQNLVNGLGARGTPTFFVNGRKLVGAVPFETMKAMVDDELAKAEALVKQGVPRGELYGRIAEKGATSLVLVAGPAAAPAPPAAAEPAAAPQPAVRVPLRPDDPARGPAAAKVTVVLFSDFQCPFCARVEPTLKQIEAAYPGDVRIVWKHQPLPFHPNALPAAKAAEAARAQGKFWEMHDRLFAGQQGLSDGEYRRHAGELKLDLGRFERDLASEAVGRRIAEDQALAASTGATGTPTLFVNCRRIVGAQPLEAFKAVIDEEIARAKGAGGEAGAYERACSANVAAAPRVAPGGSRG